MQQDSEDSFVVGYESKGAWYAYRPFIWTFAYMIPKRAG